MKKEIIFKLESPSRDSYVVYGFRFGKGEKRVAIVGALRGDALGSLYVGSKLVKFLKERESSLDGEILVIPAVNTFGLNMAHTYWPLDNSDIDVMFPGYDKGETTQRIAYGLFEKLKGYEYGIVLEGRKDRSCCIPYLKLLRSGFENSQIVDRFGLRFVHIKEPQPIDSGSLHYNWHVFGTDALSLVFGKNGDLDIGASTSAYESILRFLSLSKIGAWPFVNLYKSHIITDKNISIIKSKVSGIFVPKIKLGESVQKGSLLGEIIDSLNGEIVSKIESPHFGVVACKYDYPLIFEQAVAFRIVEV